jgi:hypothetical protein
MKALHLLLPIVLIAWNGEPAPHSSFQNSDSHLISNPQPGLFSSESIRNLSEVENCQPYFELLQATSQEWIAGVRGGGRGVNYSVRLKLITDKQIIFDSMWIAGKQLLIKIPELLKDSTTKSRTNSVITLVASTYTENSKNGGVEKQANNSFPSANKIKAPVDYKGSALVRYFVEDSIRYLEIRSFSILPTIVAQ